MSTTLPAPTPKTRVPAQVIDEIETILAAPARGPFEARIRVRQAAGTLGDFGADVLRTALEEEQLKTAVIATLQARSHLPSLMASYFAAMQVIAAKIVEKATAEDLAEASVGDLVKLAKDFTRVIQPGLDLMSPARLQVDDRSVPVTIQNLKAIVQYVHQVQEAPVSVPLPAAVEIHEVPTTDRLRRTAGQHPPTESTE